MILPGPAELALSVAVAAAFVSVPKILFRVFLGLPVSAQPGRITLLFVYVFAIQLAVCGAYGLQTAGRVGGVLLAGAVAFYGVVADRGRRFNAKCRGLLRLETRDASLRWLSDELARRERKADAGTAYARYARTADTVGVWLDAAGLTSAAVDTMQRVRAADLKPLARAQHVQQLVAFRIRCGDRETARQELATLTRPVPDALWEDAVAALEALLLVLEGDPNQGEARARPALERARQPAIRATWQAVLAHALAAQGARDEAVAILREMRSTHGAEVLSRVVRHRGAASAIAETLQVESETPYRSGA